MAETIDGRRVYIHKGAFEDVATRSKRSAYDTSRVLAKVRLAKAVHHHLVDNGVELGAVRSEVVDAILPLTVGERSGDVSRYLRRLTYTPKLPWREYPRLPVLLPDEEVADTCYQDGFYTFATGPGAAERMFEDRVPMPELKESIASGKGPDDLTIITRRGQLAHVDQAEAHTPDGSDRLDLTMARTTIDLALRRKVW